MTCTGETHFSGCPCHEANWRELPAPPEVK